MEELLEALKNAEKTVDEMLKDGRMPEEKAWECYYALAFECEINGLDDYRKALHKKINWHKFNPLDAQKHRDIQSIVQIKLKELVKNILPDDWDDKPPFKPSLN